MDSVACLSQDGPALSSAGRHVLVDALIRNRPRLVGIAARILSSRDLAEDVVQEATLRACERGLPCLQCPLNFACRMVRNLAVDRARRRQIEGRLLLPDEGADDVRSPVADALQAIEGCEALAAVKTALGTLPPRTRGAYLRHRLGGVPQKTIAAELGVSPTLVNFMIRDADQHCRDALVRLEQGPAAVSASRRFAPKHGRREPAPEDLASGPR